MSVPPSAADSFTVIINPFPYLDKPLDISGFDYYAAIPENVMLQLFWNAYSADVSVSGTGASAQVNSPFEKSAERGGGTYWVPGDRTLLIPSSSFHIVDQTDANDSEATYPPFDDPVTEASVEMNFKPTQLRRLYNGATTNEENFLGYGIDIHYSNFPVTPSPIFTQYLKLTNFNTEGNGYWSKTKIFRWRYYSAVADRGAGYTYDTVNLQAKLETVPEYDIPVVRESYESSVIENYLYNTEGGGDPTLPPEPSEPTASAPNLPSLELYYY